MSVKVSYSGMPQSVADKLAIKDTRDFLGEKRWGVLEKAFNDPRTTVPILAVITDFAGVRGYPFQALCRKYRRNEYEEWLSVEEVG